MFGWFKAVIHNTVFQVGLISCLGGILRFWGILHGFQDGLIYFWDTHYILGILWDRYLGADWIGTRTGPVFNILVTSVMQMLEGAASFLGYSIEWSFPSIAAMSSLLGAILGTATIPVVYLIGLRAFNKSTAILAALFMALCPLHCLHSHYAYRDVPMIFFLNLSILFSINLLKKPTLVNLAFSAFFALLAASIKPAGMVAALPLAVAFLIACIQRKQWFFFLLGLILLAAALSFYFTGKLNTRYSSIFLSNYYFLYFTRIEGSFFKAAKILIQFLGWLYFLAICMATVFGLLKRTFNDFVLLGFLVPGFVIAAIYQNCDDRFLLYLIPIAVILLGRMISEGWQWGEKKKVVRIGIAVACLVLLSINFIQSTWQGMLFSLPDTRTLAGKWMNAHIPRETKIATEGYWPQGLDDYEKWPNIFTLGDKKIIPDLRITSTLEHQRYLDFPDYFLLGHQLAAFYKSLKNENPIKKVGIDSIGFIHPAITILSRGSIPSYVAKLVFPRPYDQTWNSGVSFLETGPCDRDDRSFVLNWQHRYTATIVSPKTGQEMVVFLINGPKKSVVKVRIGGKSKIRTLKPGEFHILSFRPKWIFPKKPALYNFEAGVTNGTKVFIQLRCGNREIGQAYVQWGLLEKALPYLQRALEDDPDDPESNLILGQVYKQLGKSAESIQTVKKLLEKYPSYVKAISVLGQPGNSGNNWNQVFYDLTGLDPSLVTYALSQEFTTEKAFPSRSGRIEKKPEAAGGQVISFERTIHKPDEVMHGPYLFLAPGSYQARFFFRTWDVQGTGPLALVRVLMDDHVISTLPVTARDLKGDNQPLKIIQIPFSHFNPRAEIKFQVFSTGLASFSIEKIRIEPDLQKLFQDKLIHLKTIAGSPLTTGS